MISTAFYYIWNILSLGLLSAFKVAVKKGIQEQKNAEALAYAPRVVPQPAATATA